jgi:hypothetical protein
LGLVYPRGWHFLCDADWRWQVEVFRRFGVHVSELETEPADLAVLLEQTRFEEISVDAAEYRLTFANEDEWWAWSWSHGTRVLFEAVPRERLDALRQELAQGIREQCIDEAGSIQGSLHALVATAKSPN